MQVTQQQRSKITAMLRTQSQWLCLLDRPAKFRYEFEQEFRHLLQLRRSYLLNYFGQHFLAERLLVVLVLDHLKQARQPLCRISREVLRLEQLLSLQRKK